MNETTTTTVKAKKVQPYKGFVINVRKLREDLGHPHKLPREFEMPAREMVVHHLWRDTDVRCLRVFVVPHGGRPLTPSRRIYAICECGAEVSIGNLQQHRH